MAKYHNQKTVVDGIEFDSKKEARRYQQLKLMERAGVICNLQRQVKHELIPAQYIDGKCVERSVSYVSDFEYDEKVQFRNRTVILDRHDVTATQHIVEDCKGMRTQEYIVKRKLMLKVHGIRIREI